MAQPRAVTEPIRLSVVPTVLRCSTAVVLGVGGGEALFPTLPQSNEGPSAVELFIRHTMGPYSISPTRPHPLGHTTAHKAARCTLPQCGGMEGLHAEAASVWGSQGLVGV